MPKNYTQAECYAYYGVVPRNPRWSWSGRSPDGTAVAVTLWQDGFEDKGRVYRSGEDDVPGEWKSRPGFTELIDNLVLARDENEGLVHVILAVAKDVKARPRSIKKCFPQPNLKMGVTELDDEHCTFKLERIDQ